MATGYGMLGHVMVQAQNSFGTKLVSSLQAIPITGESISKTIEELAEAGMYGRFGESPYHRGTQVLGGSIEMEANPTAMGHLIKAVFGQIATTSDTNDQTHVFDPLNTGDFDDRAAVRPYTIEIHRDVGSAAQHLDMCGNQLTLNIANGEILNLSADFIGTQFSKVTAGTPSFPDVKPFLWAQSSVSFNGWAIEDMRDLTVTLNNNLEAIYTLRSKAAGFANTPYRIKRTAAYQVEISGTVQFASQSLWAAFESLTDVPLLVNFKGDTPHNCLIDVPKLRLTSFTPVIAGAGVIEASFGGRGQFHVGSANALRITLTNTHEYY